MSRCIPVNIVLSRLGLKAEDFIASGDIASIEKSIKPGEVEATSLDGVVLDGLLKDVGVNVMVDVVFSRFVWPHVEARHWHSFIFLNYCLVGDHAFGQVGIRGAVDNCKVESGRCFVIDPKRVHWLAPNGDDAKLCLLLQFAVPRRDKKTFRKVVDWMALPF